MLGTLSQNTELLAAFAAALSRWPDIPATQQTQFDIAMSRFLSNIENGLLLPDAGLLDEQVLDRISNYMVISVFSPGGGRWWNDTPLASPTVQEYIERRITKGDASMPSIDEAMPYWMAMARSDSEESGVSAER